jgi:hypothetical protein
MTHRHPTVRRVTYSNGTWTVGAPVLTRWECAGRWALNIAAVAVVLACVGAGVWEAVTVMGSMPHL